ncbi:ATP-binding protein [Methylobacterium sp. J-088]|uniref:AlbA family DNA-binding domain-containing protein n=1 Tax=Methylobacterium sp. J-088 TaxID=2836664 RepID=UPI001FBA0024|nr:ATP-binding protein [Methylobacterium sp. J-088]MCJ2065970.1 ATP-binding protein [Methylobacterium sp. J-088]
MILLPGTSIRNRDLFSEVVLMRGKAIENITIEDIEILISDGAVEDRRLEYKVDIQVSEKEQKRQRKIDPNCIPVDRSWVKGSKLSDYGRDALSEEIVAFANADGGTLVLGMDETKDAPPRAEKLNPLPDVAGLERRLRDVLLSCVEPRLPYVAVRAIQTEPDGSGVVVIEVGASALGPHWVVKTRRPTIRREDRCVPLSMSEVHDMVLRNARAFETATSRLEAIRSDFEANFVYKMCLQIPYAHLRWDRAELSAWLDPLGRAALGAQVVIMPHYDLSLPRFETMAGLLPADDALSIWVQGKEHKQQWMYIYSMMQGYERRILGGVSAQQTGGFDKHIEIHRSGRIFVSFMQHREIEKCTCRADLIVGMVAFALGVYDRLRARSSYPSAPAEVGLNIATNGVVGVGQYSGFGFNSSYGKLDENVDFDRYTFGDAQEISMLLNEVASDLFNAAGQPAASLPKAVWSDPH